MNKYWIEDTLGNHEIFEAEDDKDAAFKFYSSGDHAFRWGRADKQYFIERLEGKYARRTRT